MREGTHRDDGRRDKDDQPKIVTAEKYLRDGPVGRFQIQRHDQRVETEPQQKHDAGDDHVSCPGTEMRPQFPPDERQIGLHQDSSSFSACVTRTKMSSSEWRLRVNSRICHPRSHTAAKINGRRSTPGCPVNPQRTHSPSVGAMSKWSISGICSQQIFNSLKGAAISATTCPRSLM